MTRTPVCWLNYRGDHRSRVGGDPMGPNAFGEWLWPVEAEYDAEANRTRVGFTLIPPPREGMTLDNLPMGGCSNWRAHQAHLDAGDPLCENQR